jgi:eukaryotic-like serine/threonine-protein kinase
MTDVFSPALQPDREANAAPVETDVLLPLQVLDGRYAIVRRMGRGGVGQVYEGRHLRLGRRVAIKVLRPSLGALGEVRKRFEREARALAEVDSEYVVEVFDFGEGTSGLPYLVMEYLDGRDLRSLLREQGCMAPPRAIALIRQACQGLAAAHARRVIHRDLKPENLFVVQIADGGERCKVVDFGLARLAISGNSDVQTAVGAPLGTLHYMSPEQARGDDDIDDRTDVYGCCAVLYELLSGERPHCADAPHALLYKITHAKPRRLDQLPGVFVPTALADIVARGLEQQRARRFGSVLELAAALLGLGRHWAGLP